MKQHTLKKSYTFQGRGVHTGKPVTMHLCPAQADSGIVFRRDDLPGKPLVPAVLDYVDRTRRSTSLQKDGVKVHTPEHLLSALLGLGVDNALVCLDAAEVPILDGSARPFAAAIVADGVEEQSVERHEIVVRRPFTFDDPQSGSRLSFEPYDGFAIDVTIDYSAKSKVIGIQEARYGASADYARDIAPCRTFCLLKEVLPLRMLGLIRGGTLENALVARNTRGYVGHPELLFENEPARHKLLDLMGDLSLAGKPIRGRISAHKPGHRVNTQALKLFLSDHTL